jgi:hypothetical protein
MSEKERKVETKNLTNPYEPTPHERAVAKAYFARKEKSVPSPRMKVSMKGDVATISPDHPDAGIGHLLLMETLGASEPDFIDGLLGQLANVGTKDRAVDERGLNFMLAVVKGVEPKDQVEAMLAAQMAAVHNATMKATPHTCSCDLREETNGNFEARPACHMRRRSSQGGQSSITSVEFSMRNGSDVDGNHAKAPVFRESEGEKRRRGRVCDRR